MGYTTKVNATAIRGITFDLEGTVVDIEMLHHKAHLRAAADAGVVLSQEKAIELLPHFVGGTDEDVAAEISFLADNKVSAREILAAKRSYFDRFLAEHSDIRPRAGFNEFVNWVKELGLKLAIGTVTNHALAIHLLNIAGLSLLFPTEMVVTREEVSAPKPAPDVYLETARRVGISPQNQFHYRTLFE